MTGIEGLTPERLEEALSRLAPAKRKEFEYLAAAVGMPVEEMALHIDAEPVEWGKTDDGKLRIGKASE